MLHFRGNIKFSYTHKADIVFSTSELAISKTPTINFKFHFVKKLLNFHRYNVKISSVPHHSLYVLS